MLTIGKVRVPDGKRGPWSVSTFKVKDDLNLYIANFRLIRDGHAFCTVEPGTYRRLVHKERGVVMSTTSMERNTARSFVLEAQGRVFITGLGLGMVVEALLAKPKVTFICVVELDPDIIALTGKHYKREMKSGRLEIIQGDAYTFKLDKDDRFDFGWHDVWDDIDVDNLPSMAKLVKRFSRQVAKQFVWSRPELYRMNRRG